MLVLATSMAAFIITVTKAIKTLIGLNYYTSIAHLAKDCFYKLTHIRFRTINLIVGSTQINGEPFPTQINI